MAIPKPAPAPSVIVVGPQGCGKTQNASKIARLFAATNIVEMDEVASVQRLRSTGTVYLTNSAPARDTGLRVVQYEAIKSQLG